MGDVKIRALVITMHYSLSQAQLEKKKIPGKTLRDVETDASAETLPDTLGELKSKKVDEILTNMQIASEV